MPGFSKKMMRLMFFYFNEIGEILPIFGKNQKKIIEMG